MFENFFGKIINSYSNESKKTTVGAQSAINENSNKVYKNIEENLTQMKEILGRSDDVVFRNFEISSLNYTKVFVCYISGLANYEIINEHIIKELMNDFNKIKFDRNKSQDNIYKILKNNILSTSNLDETQFMKDVLSSILSGDTAVFIDGFDSVIIINTRDFESRNVEEASSEIVVRGSREGFVENLVVNLSLIRRRIKNQNLIFEKRTLGKETNTSIIIAYIDGIVNPKIVEEVKKRLACIETDAILESGYIEEFINDSPKSIFSTVGNSEKPEVISAKLLEGRVAIFCEGTPFVLTVPYLFIESIQSAEDYNNGYFIGTLFRFIRIIALFITLTTPALYVAITTFHHEMIPTVLLITMTASREGIPFTSSIEAILMILVFEFIREAGIRMPRPVGQAISIVGALVLGESSVAAGIVSSPMVIVIAVTGITDYVNPSLTNINIVLRFMFVLLATWLGLYGILIGFFFILAHLCSLRSFGVPYLSPLAPMILKELKDSIIRFPIWLLKSRPKSITWKDSQRQICGVKPKPPKE